VKKIKGLFRLLRFELPFSAGVCVVMGQLLALGEFAPLLVTIFGFMSVFSISASILVLNDFFDIETDKINAPHRPIPAKLVSPSEAFWLSIFLLFVGLVLSYLISIIILLFSITLAVIGFLYNGKLKKSGLIGNILVSISVGMTFIYGGATVGLPLNKMVLLFSLIAVLIDLGEEIASDAMDIKGDLIINSNSLAIKYGMPAALKISGFIFLFVVLLTFVPFIMNWLPLIYLIPILIMDFFFIYPTVRLLRSRNDEGRKYIRWIYLGATVGLLIFLAIRLISTQ